MIGAATSGSVLTVIAGAVQNWRQRADKRLLITLADPRVSISLTGMAAPRGPFAQAPKAKAAQVIRLPATSAKPRGN